MDYNSLSKSDTLTDKPDESLRSQDLSADKLDRKHSGPGIASFVIALVTVVGYILSFIIVGGMAASFLDEAGKLTSESSQAIMLLGVSILALAALNVIGVVTGIIGLTLRNRRKVLGIIGTIINAVILLLFMLLISSILVNAGSL